MKTNLNFHCKTDQVGDLQVLLFLQPVDATSSKAKDYEYFAWQKFHPAQGSHNTVELQTTYSAQVATFNSPFGQYTDPYGLNLGKAQIIANTDGSDPYFTSQTAAIEGELVGVKNGTTGKNVSVIWWVNGSRVVQTNNTDASKLMPGLTSTFELKQTLYCMFGTYQEYQTYNLQTFSDMFAFQIPNNARDLYFEINTDTTGSLVITQTTEAIFSTFMSSRTLRTVVA